MREIISNSKEECCFHKFAPLITDRKKKKEVSDLAGETLRGKREGARDERRVEDRRKSEPKGGALKGGDVVQLCVHHLGVKYQMEKGPHETRKRRCIITKSGCFSRSCLPAPECCRVIPYLTLLLRFHSFFVFISPALNYHFSVAQNRHLRDSQHK